MDWYRYFRDKYGKQNICWENCNPSEVAAAWQGTYTYVGVDDYTNIVLHEGDIIWMGEPFPTGYSTTQEAVMKAGNNAQDIFGGLKQRFDPNFDYNVANGVVTKIDSDIIELTNTRISLEEYFTMMNEIK